MKDKLRELAERWKAWREGSDWSIGIRKTCADELLAILDAEGDGGAVDRDVLAAGVRARNIEITRQQRAGEPNNEDHALRIGIAAALATNPARSGVVSDEDVEAACRVNYESDGNSKWDKLLECWKAKHRTAMRAAIEHFAKGERHES